MEFPKIKAIKLEQIERNLAFEQCIGILVKLQYNSNDNGNDFFDYDY